MVQSANGFDSVEDWAPDLFGNDRLSALDPWELVSLQTALSQSGRSTTVAYPELITEIGSPVEIQSLVRSGDVPVGGFVLSMAAQRAGEQDELDVSISLDDYTPSAGHE